MRKKRTPRILMLAFSANTKLLADLENAVALVSQLADSRLDSRLRFPIFARIIFRLGISKTQIKLFIFAWGENTKTPQQNLLWP